MMSVKIQNVVMLSVIAPGASYKNIRLGQKCLPVADTLANLQVYRVL